MQDTGAQINFTINQRKKVLMFRNLFRLFAMAEKFVPQHTASLSMNLIPCNILVIPFYTV